MANYNQSTRARIADLIIGMHVKTTNAILGIAVFTNAAQTEIFTVVGRVAIVQYFIELTGVADAALTQMQFNHTGTTPVAYGPDPMSAACDSIAAQPIGARITWIGGAVASTPTLSPTEGVTDVLAASPQHIGGQTAAGVNYAGTLGLLGSAASNAGTISATGHIFYYPISPGAYIEALV
jgi:hypothetical protein